MTATPENGRRKTARRYIETHIFKELHPLKHKLHPLNTQEVHSIKVRVICQKSPMVLIRNHRTLYLKRA